MPQRMFFELMTDDSGDGLIRAAGGGETILASMRGGNPLDPNWDVGKQLHDCSRLVTWSGTMADELFVGHPANWMPVGAESFRQRCDVIAAELAASGIEWCIRPHARHVTSDVPSCQHFLNSRADSVMTLAFDPAAMLEPSMLSALDEHLPRMFQTLGERATMVLLSDAAVDAAGDSIAVMQPGRGVMPGAMLRELVQRHVPTETPIVLAGGSAASMRAWLGL